MPGSANDLLLDDEIPVAASSANTRKRTTVKVVTQLGDIVLVKKFIPNFAQLQKRLKREFNCYNVELKLPASMDIEDGGNPDPQKSYCLSDICFAEADLRFQIQASEKSLDEFLEQSTNVVKRPHGFQWLEQGHYLLLRT